MRKLKTKEMREDEGIAPTAPHAGAGREGETEGVVAKKRGQRGSKRRRAGGGRGGEVGAAEGRESGAGTSVHEAERGRRRGKRATRLPRPVRPALLPPRPGRGRGGEGETEGDCRRGFNFGWLRRSRALLSKVVNNLPL